MAGLSVHAYTHTPPTVDFEDGKRNHCHHSRRDFTLSTTVQEHSRTLHYIGLLNCCSSSRKSGSGSRSRTSGYEAFSPLFVRCSPTQDFPGFYPRSFPLWIYVIVAISFPHGQICGSCVVFSLTYKLGDCNFILSVVYVCFPGDFISQGWVVVFPML